MIQNPSTRLLERTLSKLVVPLSVQHKRDFWTKYKHGPTSRSNPPKPYWKWTKDFFRGGGVEYVKEESSRQWKRLTKTSLPEHYQLDKTYVFEDFDSDEAIKRWKPLADSDTANGFSSAEIIRSPAGHALFRGFVNNALPDDGVTMVSGFVAMAGPQKERTRLIPIDEPWNWQRFNALELRFRGDGRKYMVVVNVSSYTDDGTAYDHYFYPLYTRGGPFWETRKIRFSQLVYAHRSSVQDHQYRFHPRRIKNINIVCQDSFDGPFALEIDYIGLRKDTAVLDEINAYEQYALPHLTYVDPQPHIDPPDE